MKSMKLSIDQFKSVYNQMSEDCKSQFDPETLKVGDKIKLVGPDKIDFIHIEIIS